METTELFKRSVGQETDIVTKEMYTFTDINGDSICLRPEGTASCIRSAIGLGLLRGGSKKLWYMGPMFRRENHKKADKDNFINLV